MVPTGSYERRRAVCLTRCASQTARSGPDGSRTRFSRCVNSPQMGPVPHRSDGWCVVRGTLPSVVLLRLGRARWPGSVAGLCVESSTRGSLTNRALALVRRAAQLLEPWRVYGLPQAANQTLAPSGRPRGQTQIGHARPRWATQQQRQDDHRDAAVRRARAQKRPGAIEDSPRDGPAARWNEPDPAVRKAPSPERPAGRRCGQPSLTVRQALARVRPEGWRA
jgi:hypothetical protein